MNCSNSTRFLVDEAIHYTKPLNSCLTSQVASQQFYLIGFPLAFVELFSMYINVNEDTIRPYD